MGSARWNALDTWCEVLTVREADLPEVAALAHARLAELTDACLGADSELAGLASGRPQRISDVLALALEAALRTSGFTDDRVGAGWRDVDLDRAASRVTVPEGLCLDVAASVRSWASDWVARSCADALGVGCLVNLGGDIAVRGEVPDGGWQVEIEDGPPDSRGYPVISMGWPGGLATRSATSGAWRSVTVAARTCERAGAAAGAAILMDDAAPRWLTQRELPARLVHAGGVVVQTNGWPQERRLA